MVKYITIIFMCLSIVSCAKKDAIDEESSVLTLENNPDTELQNWINKNYIDTYNIDIVYLWESSSAYDKTILYPPKEDNIKQVLEATKKLWLDLYKEEMGEDILEYCIKAASGEIIPKAVQLNQDDFIPWKRGVSL